MRETKRINEMLKSRTRKVLLGTSSVLAAAMFMFCLVPTPVAAANVDYYWQPEKAETDFTSFTQWDVLQGFYVIYEETTANAADGLVHMRFKVDLGDDEKIIGTAGFITPSNERYTAQDSSWMHLRATWQMWDQASAKGGVGTAHITQKIYVNLHDLTSDTWLYPYGTDPVPYTVMDIWCNNWLVTYYDCTPQVTWDQQVYIQEDHVYEIKSWISVCCHTMNAPHAGIDMSTYGRATDLISVGLYNN